MDKNAIKKFATEARRELLHRVSQKALMYGISEQLVNSDQWSVVSEQKAVNSEKSVQLPDTDALGRLLTDTELAQRDALLEKILEEGYTQVMEEVAYTWFNRFSALRFMEVNGYLPSKVRIFTDLGNRFQPQILTEAIHLDMEGLDVEKVFAYKEANDTEGLFRYLLITQCNALSTVLPGMFQPISDYTELLLPEGLLKEDSVIRLMIDTVPEEDWRDAVQIIGWLYQYYNSEKKDEVFAALKKNVKITKDNIPAATQLFTPDWIVRYMVENSLGRTYIRYKLSVDSGQMSVGSEEERQAKEKEIAESLGWKYYIPEAKQTEEVRKQLNPLNPDTFDPKGLRLLDPCAGSGHILAYMFDVLVTIYQDYGYTTREAAASIVSQNLYGLDIDTRAAQLAYFTVMMKARQYDRRFFSRGIQPHVHAITESNHVGEFARNHFALDNPSVKEAFDTILEELRDAKEYGSILTVTPQNWEALESNLEELEHSTVHSDGKRIRNLLQTAETLSQKYDVVVTNPPYMGASNMNPKLNDFIKKNYADYKSDFFSAFVIHCSEMTKETGYCGFLTPYVWMFIQSYEKMRNYLYNKTTIETLIQFEYSAFEEATVPICTFAFRNTPMKKKGCYLRLVDFRGGMEVQRIKTLEAIENPDCGYYYEQSTDNFIKIPGNPVAYWVGDAFFKMFNNPSVADYTYSDGQNKTGDNDTFLRYFWEIINTDVGEGRRWLQLAKGGGFRRWYGNIINVIDWSSTARQHYKEDKVSRIIPEYLWYKKGITWGDITSYKPSFRMMPDGMTFETAGLTIFPKNEANYNFLLGLLNSCTFNNVSQTLNATFHTKIKDVQGMPFVLKNKEQVETIVTANIALARADWDAYETSWDFKKSPLITNHYSLTTNNSGQQSVNSEPSALTTNHYPLATNDHYPLTTTLAERYENWKQTCNARFKQLQQNEEELNRIFIDIYGLQEELTPEVADKDVTVHCIFDTKEDIPESLQGSNYVRTKRDEIVSFISYAVGCMLGRYSLESEGLFFAGGELSDQWVAVSGQYYERKVVEYYVSKELSRSCGMAEVYVHSGGDISIDEDSSELGKIFVIGSDETSSDFNSFQYRRGTSQKLYEGIQAISLHSEGIGSGTRNSVYDLCSPEILKAISDRDGNELARRGWKDADRIDWSTIHSSLTTNHFTPDEDNVLPICDDEYFQDDIVGRLIEFVRVVYGEETLEENLEFISQALGGKKGERPKDVLRNYFLKDFYKDHCKMYQKRPIYWLFDSGKKNGFKCLVYLHRYRRDTIARIRTDYIHPQQSRYRTLLEDLESRLEDASTAEKVRLRKEIKLRSDQLTEIHEYEEKIHHLADSMISIDLDDGVKKNYAIFQDVLAKIK